MAGRLGIDFGTSNTVVTLWNPTKDDSESLQLKDYSRIQETDSENVFIVPSLIHFAPDYKYLYGEEVLKNNLYHSPRTFQWMKKYISQRSPIERHFDDKRVNYFDAGKRFLSEIMNTAATHVQTDDEEIVLTVPVEAFEDYSHWLSLVAGESNVHRYRIIDEPSAAALGYGADLTPDDVYLVFDFGGGTLDVAVVAIEADAAEQGKFCRVLGKAGIDLGGTSIDEWLFQEVLARSGQSENDTNWKAVSRLVLTECERVKEALSFREEAELSVLNPMTGDLISEEFTRTQFEDLLDKHEAFAKIDKTIRRALSSANEKGFGDEDIKAILMTGGCSQIPAVQKTLKRIFGNEKVSLKRPLDAVARGASRFAAGMAFKDFIQHDYAVRYVNSLNGRYEYRPIVKRGTQYPTTAPVAAITIKASFDDQELLGIPIFEIGSSSGTVTEQRMEMVFDETGIPRVQAVTEKESKKRTFFWINESNPTFLRAVPPAQRGEPYFRVEFNIDINRKLVITVQNVKTSEMIFIDYPVAKLI